MGWADAIPALLWGVLAFFSPCMLPIVPALLTSVGSAERVEGVLVRRKRWFLPAALFVLGLGTTFTLLGAGHGALGSLLVPYEGEIRWVFGVVLVAFGLFMMMMIIVPGTRYGKYMLAIPGLRRLINEAEFRGRLMGRLGKWKSPLKALLIGAGFGVAWSPCITPFLGGILTYILNTQDMATGSVLLAFFSLGMGIPFIAMAGGGAWVLSLPKLQAWIPRIHLFSGVVLVAYGVVLIMDWGPAVSGFFAGIIGYSENLFA